jgi:hypothetical protein
MGAHLFFRRLSNITRRTERHHASAGRECYKPPCLLQIRQQAAKMNILAAKEIYNELKKRFEKLAATEKEQAAA